MPFDGPKVGTKIAPVGNSLESLGITPVPRAQAELHKEMVTKRFAAQSKHETNMVKSGRAYWRSVSHVRLKRILTGSPSFGFSTPDLSTMPIALVNLAKFIEYKISPANFSVEFFHDDPILNVTYYDANQVAHYDCLGIWDNGKIVAIATRPSRLSEWLRWFSL